MGGRHGARTYRAREEGLLVVRQRLQQYADRGVFRGFAEESPWRGRHRFKFLWLSNSAFRLHYSPKSGEFVVRNLLPNVPVHSDVGKDLRGFLKGLTSLDVPEHRRIDQRRVEVRSYVRSGVFSIVVTAKKNQHGYAVRRVINLIQEVFVRLHTYFPEYMWENFDAPQE